MDRAVSRRVAVLALPLTVLLAGCDLSSATCRRATDEWTHTYSADRRRRSPDRQHQRPDRVEGVDGSTVEVRAERIAKGATEAAAKDSAADRHQGGRQA
jgi:hypothetical protein